MMSHRDLLFGAIGVTIAEGIYAVKIHCIQLLRSKQSGLHPDECIKTPLPHFP